MVELIRAADLMTYLRKHGIDVHLVRRDGGGHLTVFMTRALGELPRAALLAQHLDGVRTTRQTAAGVLRVIVEPVAQREPGTAASDVHKSKP